MFVKPVAKTVREKLFLQGDHLLMSKTGSTFRPLKKAQSSWDLIHSYPKAGQFLTVHRTKK